MTLLDVPADLLVAHPENSNFMDTATLKKLKTHIEQTGRYEPLTVRPHPSEKSKFQVINGHNRLRVLRGLQHPTVRCIVWDLDDTQTRLYLATLNPRTGHEIPEQRMALLENLLADVPLDALAGLLPDDRRQLEELERVTHLEFDHFAPLVRATEVASVLVFLTYVLEEHEATKVNLALDVILDEDAADQSRARALVGLADFFLKHRRPVEPSV